MNDNEGVATLNSRTSTIARILMARRGMTQTDLAKVLDMDKALVSRLFAGKRMWQLDEIEDMARYFKVDPALFFEDADRLIPTAGEPPGNMFDTATYTASLKDAA